MGPGAEVVRQIAVVGEVAEKVETPNGNNQPQTGIGRTGEAPADAPRSIGRSDRRMPAGAERSEKQPRSEARMDFEGRRQQREQQRADRLPGIGPADRRFGPRIPGPGIVVGPAGFALIPRPAPGRGDASGAPRELQRDGDPALDIGRDQQVQARAEYDIGVSVAPASRERPRHRAKAAHRSAGPVHANGEEIRQEDSPGRRAQWLQGATTRRLSVFSSVSRIGERRKITR